eukprot:8351321-Pyramimonas_sp.AAC.1
MPMCCIDFSFRCGLKCSSAFCWISSGVISRSALVVMKNTVMNGGPDVDEPTSSPSAFRSRSALATSS